MPIMAPQIAHRQHAHALVPHLKMSRDGFKAIQELVVLPSRIKRGQAAQHALTSVEVTGEIHRSCLAVEKACCADFKRRCR